MIKYPITALHISDLHFGATDQNKEERLKSLIKEVHPDLIFVTGDIVNWPRPKYLKIARGFLRFAQDHTTKVFVVPGNHDALFGGLSRRSFKKHIGKSPFAEWIEIKGLNCLVFGFDSTYPYLNPYKINTGYIGNKSLTWFKSEIQRLKGERGDFAYESALKIALLHHHPLPTIASQAQSLLYLNGSGTLLNALAREEMDLVLHGHQHDPCDYSINYNQGGDEDFMIVLSAGTATKSATMSFWERIISTLFTFSTPTARSQGNTILQDSAFFLIKFDEQYVDVQQFNYKATTKQFVMFKGFRKRRRTNPISVHSHVYRYTIRTNGDLEEEAIKTVGCKTGCRLPYLEFPLGVDDRSPGLIVGTISELKLRIWRNETDITNKANLITNEPRWKVIRIELDPPIKELSEEIRWTHVWPGGWKNLIQNGMDLGSYAPLWPTKEFSVELSFESPLDGRIAEVSYMTPEIASDKRFTIKNLPRNAVVTYRIQLKKR